MHSLHRTPTTQLGGAHQAGIRHVSHPPCSAARRHVTQQPPAAAASSNRPATVAQPAPTPITSASSSPQQQAQQAQQAQQRQQRQRGAVLSRAGARERSGPSGLNVGGHSPTSPSGWDAMRAALTRAGVKVVSPQEVVFAAERDNIVIIDVRPEDDYDKGHVPNAFNVPFYRPIQGWDAFKVARRVGYAMFGILNGTEVNPDFVQEVREVLRGAGAGPDKPIVLYCSQGGVLESNETYKRGWQTRSLVAAFDLTQEGLTNVQVMKDGYTGWFNSGRDIEILEYAEEGEEGSVAA